MKKVFRSRISVLLLVFILACFLPGLIPAVRSGHIFSPIIYILIFVIALMAGMRYTIKDKQLTVKICGIPFRTFPLSAIVSIERSYNPLSAPAASLKRLTVNFKNGFGWPFTLISPAHEQEFLDTLKEQNPDIYIRVTDKKDWWRIWDWDI